MASCFNSHTACGGIETHGEGLRQRGQRHRHRGRVGQGGVLSGSTRLDVVVVGARNCSIALSVHTHRWLGQPWDGGWSVCRSARRALLPGQ